MTLGGADRNCSGIKAKEDSLETVVIWKARKIENIFFDRPFVFVDEDKVYRRNNRSIGDQQLSDGFQYAVRVFV